MYVKIENQKQIDLLADLASQIWHEHFGPMFAPEKLEHIIQQVQSKEAICAQIEEGYLYFFIPPENHPTGYFAYKIDPQKKELFLSKLYLKSTERKKGIGRKVLEHLEHLCREKNLKTITLTVYNKNELAITAYEKMGFINKGHIKRDFGNDLLCDDFVMEKSIS